MKKALFILLTGLLSTHAHAIGNAIIRCDSENVSLELAVPYGAFKTNTINMFHGQIDFFGEQIEMPRLGYPANQKPPNHYILARVENQDGENQYNYDFFGGYQLLFKTGIYKFRLSIFREHFKVYGVDRKITIDERDLLEEGSCQVLGV